jgi:hypothetical protein
VFGEGLAHALDLSGGFTRFRNSAGMSDDPQRESRFWKGYFRAEREQEVPWGTLDLGTYWELSRYTYVLDERFTNLSRATDTNGLIHAYVQTRFDFGDRVTLTPSIGSQLSGFREAPTYEPRLRLSVFPDGTPQQEVTLALGKYNQFEDGITDKRDAGTVFTVWTPSFSDDNAPQALHAILGYRQRIGSQLQLSVEGYAKDLSNIPVPTWTPIARFNTEFAFADGQAYGADVRAEWDAGPLYLFAGYGWSTVTYEASTDDLGAWVGGDLFEYSPSHDRRHQISTVASYEMGPYSVNLSWQYGSGRPYTQVYGFDLALRVSQLSEAPTQDPGTALTYYGEPYGARLPAYHRLDASVQRTFDLSARTSMETTIGAINLYDRSNVFYYDINTLERVDQTRLLPYVSLRIVLD